MFTVFPICLSVRSSSFLYEVDKVSVFSRVRKLGSVPAVGNRCALLVNRRSRCDSHGGSLSAGGIQIESDSGFAFGGTFPN